MKKIKVFVVLLVVLLTTGCGSAIKDKDKKLVVYKETGQSIQNNILCRPKNEKLLDLYKKYDKQLKISIKKLPECKNFKIKELADNETI